MNVLRSKLFVPGSRPELFAKALASAADAISVDLEDAVDPSRKGEARQLVAELLQRPDGRSSTKALIVRVNALGTEHFEADVLAVARPGLALVNLPKVESPDQVRAAIAVLERAEAANGVHAPIGVLVNIETPTGLRLAAAIAAAHHRVVGLQLGYADLFEPLGVNRRDAANVHATMFALRMAAGEAGVFAYDGAFTDVTDPEGFRTEAGMARRLGFWGKSCIHPSQVALANEIFQPTATELAQARRIVAAAQTAAASGTGAFLVDGRMIDAPAVRRAHALLALAAQLQPPGVAVE